MSKQISAADFKAQVLDSKEPVFVDFYADWCGPCRMLSPVMDQIGQTHKVVKVNVDEDGELASAYGIMSIPCVILFKGGKEAGRSIGLVPKEQITKLLGE